MKAFPYAVAAGTGFALALLSGLVGGVGLGEGFLRGLLAAAIFGGGAIGLHQMLLRFVPELFAPPSSVPPEGVVLEPRFDLTVGGNEDNFMTEVGDSDSRGSSIDNLEEGEIQGEPQVPASDFDEMDDFSAQRSFSDLPEDQEEAPQRDSSRAWNGLGSMDDRDDVLLEGMKENPGTLAKAVQSVMKRDKD